MIVEKKTTIANELISDNGAGYFFTQPFILFKALYIYIKMDFMPQYITLNSFVSISSYSIQSNYTKAKSIDVPLFCGNMTDKSLSEKFPVIMKIPCFCINP